MCRGRADRVSTKCLVTVGCLLGALTLSVRGEGAEPFGVVEAAGLRWRHLSSRNGDLPTPGESTQQTGAVVADLDGDGVHDFVLSFREKAPALVWYRRTHAGWERYVIEKAYLTVEAGGAIFDVDGDGRMDILDKPYNWDAPRVDVWLQEAK